MGKRRETSRKTYQDPVSSITKPTWGNRGANSEPQRWETTNSLRYELGIKLSSTRDRLDVWDTMKLLYWMSVNSKDAGRPCLMHHHRGGWNEMDEMNVEKWWNKICGRGKQGKPREKPTQAPFRPPWNSHACGTSPPSFYHQQWTPECTPVIWSYMKVTLIVVSISLNEWKWSCNTIEISSSECSA